MSWMDDVDPDDLLDMLEAAGYSLEDVADELIDALMSGECDPEHETEWLMEFYDL